MRLLVLDCDSTLSAIEGVDELARLRGEACFAQSEALTNAAMDGQVAVESVFAKRLELIKPSKQMVEAVGKMYLEQMIDGAHEGLAKVRELGWEVVILSGGFLQAIEPLAAQLGIDQIEAVRLSFDEQGNYAGFDESYPTTRSGGKPEVIRELKLDKQPEKVVMVGDGVSDLETKADVDAFVGCFAFVEREQVVKQAQYSIKDFSELPSLLEKL